MFIFIKDIQFSIINIPILFFALHSILFVQIPRQFAQLALGLQTIRDADVINTHYKRVVYI